MPWGKFRQSLSFDWGVSQAYDAEIRTSELCDRVWWFIAMRWIAVGMCAAGALGAALGFLPIRLSAGYFLLAAAFLGLTNYIYFQLAGRFTVEPVKTDGIRSMLFAQILTDYMTLSLITYASGGMETLVLILFLPHVILASLFFTRAQSLAMTLMGAFFAGLPLFLERAFRLPIPEDFATPLRQRVFDSFPLTMAYIFAVAASFLVCWYLISEVTTSLRRKESQLEDAHKKLILLDREKTQATVRATHELKAPFAAIKSYVYTLRDGYCGELPDKAQQVVTRIGDRCDLLTKKITDIIHLSNLKTLVVRDLHFTEVNLTEAVAKEAKEAALLAEPGGITVVNHAADFEPALIRASSEHLHTMLSNLLANAVIYSRKGGTVEISMRAKSDTVSVRILDHGIGIPKENIPKIFDEHFRSNNAVEHYPNGNGMSLAMVKEVARLHGAVIHVSSDVEHGTHFTVTFGLIDAKPNGGNHGEDPNY